MTLGTWIVAAASAVSWLVFAGLYPRKAVWCVMLWIPIQGWAQLNIFDDSSATVLIYEFGILGVYLVFALRALELPRMYKPPSVLFFAAPFALWALLLVPYSLGEGGFVLTVIGLRTYLLPLPLVWLGYHAFRDRSELERLGALLAVEMAVIGLVAALQFANLVTTWGSAVDVPRGYSVAGVLRPPGTFSTPGHLGMYVLAMIPVSIGFLGLRTGWSRRAAYSSGVAGAFLALIVNSQRAAVALICVGLPLVAVLARRAIALRVLAIATGVAVIGIGIGLSVVREAFGDRVRSISNDANYALLVAPVERLTEAFEKPLLGAGLGSASPGVGRLNVEASNSAETFMAALVFETGFPGLVFFYLFMGALAWQGFRALRVCRSHDFGLLAASILAYEAMIWLQSWTYDPLHYPPSRIIFWFWAGVLVSLPRLALLPRPNRVSRPSAVSGRPLRTVLAVRQSIAQAH